MRVARVSACVVTDPALSCRAFRTGRVGFSANRWIGMISGRRVSLADMGRPGVSLLPHERVAARLTGNHIRDGKAYEGYLYVTSKRLVYVPWSAAQFRGAVPFDISLAEVTGADTAPGGTNWRDGSWRRRLRVTKS